MKTEREFIELTPRFEMYNGDSCFSGYHQTDGTHCYDTAEKKYRFVPEKLLIAQNAEVEKLKRALRYYMTLDKNPAELGDLIFRKAVGDRAREALEKIGGEE